LNTIVIWDSDSEPDIQISPPSTIGSVLCTPSQSDDVLKHSLHDSLSANCTSEGSSTEDTPNAYLPAAISAPQSSTAINSNTSQRLASCSAATTVELCSSDQDQATCCGAGSPVIHQSVDTIMKASNCAAIAGGPGTMFAGADLRTEEHNVSLLGLAHSMTQHDD
jgi:hypothetical protein